MKSIENISYDIKQFVEYKNFRFTILFTETYNYLSSTVIEVHFDYKFSVKYYLDRDKLVFLKNYKEKIDMSREFFEFKRKRKLNYILYGKSMEKCDY